jgi:hypothetical protein
MPSLMVNPRVFIPTGFPASSATTATITGASFVLPIADSYTAIVDVGTATGTSPTLDVAFQHSPDNGTSWYTFAKFAQITATGQRQLVFTPQVAVNQAASEGAIANTGAAVALNTPIVYSAVRVLATVGGTTPSFATIKLFVICAPAGSSLLS